MTINKEKLINFLNNEINAKDIRSSQIICFSLKESIENGEFDSTNLSLKNFNLELEKIKQKLLDLQETLELQNQDIKGIVLIYQELQLLQDSLLANSN